MSALIIVAVAGGIFLLPLLIALLYTVFYNKHINGGSGKKWLSPPLVWLIAFLVMVVAGIGVAAAGFICYKVDPNRNLAVDTTDNYTTTFTEAAFNESAYTAFNGKGVSGYKLENRQDGDFTYQLYSKVSGGPAMMPDYVIILKYTGDNAYHTASTEYVIKEKGGSAGQGELLEASPTYYAVIDAGHITFTDKDGNELRKKYNLQYSLDLYNITYEDAVSVYSGNLDKTGAVASFSIKLD